MLKVALTGGPCGGKTTSIKTIEEFYRTFGEDGSKASTIVDSFYDRHFVFIKKL